jgi:hypothetical protein
VIRQLFERKASYEAEVLAEAQALIDDGLDLDFVLDLFPDEADWLAPLLETTTGIAGAMEAESASYYFEASLKSKFLGAEREPKPVVPVVIPAPAFSPVRTAIATFSVAGMAAAVGIVSLGFITAGDSVPGDWNYTFKLANERFEYATSRGDHRIDLQVKQVQARIVELNKLSERGDVSPSQLERVQREWEDLQNVARDQELDAMRQAQIESARRSAVAVINDVTTRQPDLLPRAEAVAAAIGDTVTGLAAPSPTATATATATAPASATESPTATPEPSPSATATPTPEATPAGTETPSATATPAPTESATPEPSATSTEQPAPSETAAPSPSPAP